MVRFHCFAGLLAVAAACSGEAVCLDDDCPSVCDRVTTTCTGGAATVVRLGTRPGGSGLARGQGGAQDIVLDNGVVTAVIADIGANTGIDLSTTGGTLVDYGPSGGRDDITQIYQLAGILPEDTFSYYQLTIDDRGPEVVAVNLRGTLDGRPDVRVATRWELRACDQAIRVRTELFNGSDRGYAWIVADGVHWGTRRGVPLVPLVGQGYVQPELDLLELSAQWTPSEYVLASTPDPDAPGYGITACSQRMLAGVSDPEITAVGTDLTVVSPGETLVYERLISTAGSGQGPALALAPLLDARSQLFGEPAPRVLTGRVISGSGTPLGGDVRRASLLIFDQSSGAAKPLVSVVPAIDGTFAVAVPPGTLGLELWSFGRPVLMQSVTADVIGDLQVAAPGTVQVAVSLAGQGPVDAQVVFVPADASTETAVTGTFHGRFASCAPWLGPTSGPSPACNRALISPGGTDIEVPAGRYHVVASTGPNATLARATIEVTTGQVATVDLALEPIDLLPPGWLSADLHVHGRASFDSSLPDTDRVRTFVAAGVEVVAATDHDAIADYAETVAMLSLGDRVAVMGGLETTPLLPFLDVPGVDVPRVIGHFNFWPLAVDPAQPRGGAPFDERLEPGQLFDRMQPLIGEDGIIMMNHPWDEPFFGRDLGYLRAIDFDPRQSIVVGAQNGELLRAPGAGARNADWNAIEVLNGAGIEEYLKARVVWFSLISQGFVTVGTGNSDSHSTNDNQLGWGRNWVQTSATVANFDPAVFNSDLRQGRSVAGSGVFVLVEVGPAAGPRRGLGFEPHTQASGDVINIEVRAPAWVPVSEVRIVTSSGTRVVASGADLLQPPDPFAVGGVVRWQGQLALSELVTGDDWIVVEAGFPLPVTADLDDDGVPDTSDNNLDGVVDAADVEEGEDEGPINTPPNPTSETDPRYWLTRVIPGAYPLGFSNPLLIDSDGNGWQPPGVQP